MIAEPMKTDWSAVSQEVVSTADLTRVSGNINEIYTEDLFRRLSGALNGLSSTVPVRAISSIVIEVPVGHSVILRSFKGTVSAQNPSSIGDVAFSVAVKNLAGDVLLTEGIAPMSSGLTNKAWVQQTGLNTLLHTNTTGSTEAIEFYGQAQVVDLGYYTAFIDALFFVRPTV